MHVGSIIGRVAEIERIAEIGAIDDEDYSLEIDQNHDAKIFTAERRHRRAEVISETRRKPVLLYPLDAGG